MMQPGIFNRPMGGIMGGNKPIGTPPMGNGPAPSIGAMQGNSGMGQNGIGPSNDMLMQLLPLLMQQQQGFQKSQIPSANAGGSIFTQANQPMSMPQQPMPANEPVYPGSSFSNEMPMKQVDPSRFRF